MLAGQAESEKGLSSPVPDQQRSSSCFSVCSVGFPAAHLSFVCLSHGAGRLRPSQVWQVQIKVVDSGLVSHIRSSRRERIAKQCLGARFRARSAVIFERSPLASTTESASRQTDAVSLFTRPATEWFGSVPAYWEQPGAAYYGCLGSVSASWEQ